jgi:trehalose/maltose transport system substrate-binding protein
LNYAEEEARALFQTGNAVFMRNWPYAYALANAPGSPVQGKVGIAALPAGPSGRAGNGALGGGLLAVSRYSTQIKLAVDLTLFMTSAAEQKRRALAAGYNPTLPGLYQDADILREAPSLAPLAPMIQHAVARPAARVGTRYNQVSAKFWSAVHRVLTGDDSPEAALATLQRELQRLQRVGRW